MQTKCPKKKVLGWFIKVKADLYVFIMNTSVVFHNAFSY